MSPATWIVCEGGDRWQRALHRFTADRPHGADRYVFRTATAGQARALVNQQSRRLMMWEISAITLREAVEAIAACASHSDPPLQIVCCGLDVEMREADLPRLVLALRQLGADLVLRHPEQVPLALRLGRTYLAHHRLSQPEA